MSILEKKGGEAPLNLLNSHSNLEQTEVTSQSTLALPPRSGGHIARRSILTTGGLKIDKDLKVTDDVIDLTVAALPTPTPAKRGRPSGERKLSRKFAITIRLGKIVPVDIKAWYVTVAPKQVSYCITLERGVGDCCENHLHVYSEFECEYDYMYLINYFTSFFNENKLDYTFHVEGIKNLSKYLRYITKEDIDPLFENVNTNSFSFHYHAAKHLREMEHWDVSHWFVVEHRNCYKYLEQLWIKLHANYSKIAVFLWPCVLYPNKWFLDLYEWWTSFVSTSHYPKKKHMYLYGPSNVGKTTAVNMLVRDLFNRVYYAADQHPFGGFNSKYHRCIVFEEFRSSKFDMTIINKCLEGMPFYCNQKYQVERLDRCIYPVIFISNFPPPNYDHFLNRVNVINTGDDALQVCFGDPIVEVSIIEGIEDDSS